MTEPTPTKSIDLRLDDSKTASEISALTDGDNKLMVASDTGDIWHIDPSGNKQNLSDGGGGMAWQVVGTDTNASNGNGYLVQGTNTTITFPASPSAGDTIGVKAWNQQDGSQVAIDGQGVYFNGQDEIQYLDDNVSRIYSYTASGGVFGWVEVSDYDRRIAEVPISPAVTPDTETVGTPARTVQNTDKVHSLFAFENELLQSVTPETTWTATQIEPLVTSTGVYTAPDKLGNTYEMRGLIPSANGGVATSHYISIPVPTVVGIRTYCIEASPGDKPWMALLETSANVAGYFNNTTGEIGLSSGPFRGATSCVLPNGNVRYCMEYDAVASGGASFRIYLAASNGSSTFIGDGVTVATYISNIHSYPGTIADNIQHIATTTTALIGESKMVLTDNTAAKYGIGACQKLGETGWEIPKESSDSTQYVYIAPDNFQPLGKGKQVLMMVTGALSNADTLGTATKIIPGVSEIEVTNGVNRINYVAGATELLYLTGASGSGTISVQETGGNSILSSTIFFTRS